MERKEINIGSATCQVTVERFDDGLDIDDGEYAYHGFSYHVEGEGIKFWFKNYDDESKVGYFSEDEGQNEIVSSAIKEILEDPNVTVFSLRDIK